jgi:hypothetical protein
MNHPTNKFRNEFGTPMPKDRSVCDCEVALVHVAKHEPRGFQNAGKVFQEPKRA